MCLFRFLEEVVCDKGEAKRSQATGFLTVSAPKIKPDEIISPQEGAAESKRASPKTIGDSSTALLEVTGFDDCMDFSRIVHRRPDSASPPPLEDVD